MSVRCGVEALLNVFNNNNDNNQHLPRINGRIISSDNSKKQLRNFNLKKQTCYFGKGQRNAREEKCLSPGICINIRFETKKCFADKMSLVKKWGKRHINS